MTEWVALAGRPDPSRIPGYAEARAGLLKTRSRKVVEGISGDTNAREGREFGSSGVKLDDYGTFLRYDADVKSNLISLDFEKSVEDVECDPEMMKIKQRVTGTEHKFVTGEYVTASSLWNCGDGPAYRKITGVVSVNNSIDGKFSVVVVSTKDVPFTELFDYVSANTFYTGYAKKFVNDVRRNNTFTKNNETRTRREKRKSMIRSNTLTVTYPYDNQRLVDGSVLPLRFTTDVSLGSDQYFWVTLTGENGDTVFEYKINSAGSSYNKNIPINDGPLCGVYTLYIEWCGRWTCDDMDQVDNIHFNYIDKLLVINPHAYDEFKSGDSVAFQWDYEPNGGETQDVYVSLYSMNKDGTVKKKSDCYWDGKMTGKRVSFGSNCFTSGERYKFTIEYNTDGETGSSITASEVFLYDRSSEDRSLNVYEPEMGALLQSGQTVTVKWEPYGWTGSEKINIYLYESQWGFDELLYSMEGVSLSAKKKDITIPAQSVVGSGTNYYFYIGYDCGTLWCSEGFYSETFSINYNPPYRITNELDDDTIYFPGFDRKVTWTTTVTTPDDIYVSVKAKYPSIVPLPDKTLAYVKTTATARSAVVHPDTGTTLRAYYEIEYDCWFFGYLCSKVTSKTFNLVDFNVKQWNEDENGDIIEQNKNFYHAGCDTECTESSTSLFCKACDANIDMNMDVTCENCHAKVSAGFYGMELEFLGLSVKSFQVSFYGRAEMEFHLNGEATVSYYKEHSIPIFTFSPNPYEFFIGPISILLSLKLTGKIPLTVSMDAALQARIESEGILNIFANAQYGTRIPTDERGVTINTRYTDSLTPSYEFNAHAEATLSAGFRVGIEASFLNILAFNAYAEATASLHGELNRFPALGTEKLFENTTWNYGSCSNSHYLEYYLRLTSDAHADATFWFFGDHSYSKDFQLTNPWIILSGCLLPAESSEKNQTIYTKVFGLLGVHRGEIPFPDNVLEAGLADELCRLMGWPKGLLKVTALNTGNTTNGTIFAVRDNEIMLEGIDFMLLPATAAGAQQYSTKDELEISLANELNNPSSLFYSGTVGRYFKGKFVKFNESSSSSTPSSSDVSSSSKSSIMDCPQNYKFIDGICVECTEGECCPGGKSAGISNCGQCTEDLQNCVSCNPGTKYVEVSSGRGICESCGDDECCLGKDFNVTCASCNEDMTKCTTCHPGYYLTDGICSDKRPSSGSRVDIMRTSLFAFILCVLIL